jgi:hypothetical protein
MVFLNGIGAAKAMDVAVPTMKPHEQATEGSGWAGHRTARDDRRWWMAMVP